MDSYPNTAILGGDLLNQGFSKGHPYESHHLGHKAKNNGKPDYHLVMEAPTLPNQELEQCLTYKIAGREVFCQGFAQDLAKN